jgi:hypothetical protein
MELHRKLHPQEVRQVPRFFRYLCNPVSGKLTPFQAMMWSCHDDKGA